MFFILACSIIWSINIKFNGLGYAAIFCLLFYIYWLYLTHKNNKNNFWIKFRNYTLFYIIVVMIAILIVGNTSYLINLIRNGNLFYPLKGENHVDNMVVKEQPSSFEDKNNLEIFLISLFSKGVNTSPTYSSDNIQPELKIPFTFTKSEIKNYSIPEIRMSGFGPLFSGIFILSIIFTIGIIINLIKNKKYNETLIYIALITIIFGLILSLDGSYWARYISYLYIIPIITLIVLFKSDKKIINLIAYVFSAIMILNSVMILYSNVKSTRVNSSYISSKIEDFKEFSNSNENVDIVLNHEGVQSILYNLDDIHISNYTVKKDIVLDREGYFFKY